MDSNPLTTSTLLSQHLTGTTPFSTVEEWSLINRTYITYVLDLGPKRDSLSTVVPMTVVYIVILVSGLIGNICTCVVIIQNKYMHTATNYYLFSLAISDLLLLVLGLPQEMYHLWNKYPYIFGEAFCIIRGLTSETSTNASILTITSFTMERYLAICHPLRAHTMSKLSRAIKLIVLVWLCGALCAIPLAIQFGIVYQEFDDKIITETAACTLKRPLKHAFECSTFFFFILPMTVIMALYILIGIQLRKSSSVNRRNAELSFNTPANGVNKQLINRSPASVRRHPPVSATQSNRSIPGVSSRRTVIKMLVAVVVAFFLCWAPFHAQRLLAIYVRDPTPTDVMVYNVLTYISGVTYYVSATINPILYNIMSLKFRQAFKDTLARCCGRKPSRSGTFVYRSHPNSTIRSTGRYDGTEFSLVSDSPRQSDSVKSKRRHENGKANVSVKGQNETELSKTSVKPQENGFADATKKNNHSMSETSLQMVEVDFDTKEISDYILKMKILRT